jgi:NAD(P)H-dependent FMN reductase
MITVISGTNRPDSNTIKIARLAVEGLQETGEEVALLDLAELPLEIFAGSSYREKPESFVPFQEAVIATDGILTVIPEYNGSCPGAMKYFIDMLRFPDSLYEKPAGFIGLSAGPWGAVRAVEQVEMVFQYRHAHLFGRRVFIPNVGQALGDDGRLADAVLARRFGECLEKFADFCRRLQD